mmetsp:Transcript_46837/g.117251  ORF Transcript_46837/g.117251 Transcript_46837/m.117251 type:complete len:849 (+) Transcript_46837:187-2733(+)
METRPRVDDASSDPAVAVRVDVASKSEPDEDQSESTRARLLEERDTVPAVELPIAPVAERAGLPGKLLGTEGPSNSEHRPGKQLPRPSLTDSETSTPMTEESTLPSGVQHALEDAGLVVDEKVFDPEDEEALGKVTKVKWYKQKKLLVRAAFTGLSLMLMGAGVVLATEVSPERLVTFRWCLFIGSIIPLFYVCKSASSFFYYCIEVYHFQEPLYHFTSLRSTTHHLMFFGILLVWYFVVFEWVWCSGIYARVCAEPAYREVTQTMMKILACALLASLATFLAALVAKLISTHFLKNTHFKKLRVALEKESMLKTISNPRMRRKPAPVAKGATGGTANGVRSTWGSGISLNTYQRGHKRSKSIDNLSSVSASEEGSHHNIIAGKIPKNSSHDDLSALARLKLAKNDGKLSQAMLDDGAPSSGASSPMSTSSRSVADFSELDPSRQTVTLEIGQAVIEGLNLEMLKDASANQVHEMTEDEIDKLRTAVVIKTSSAMLRQHKFRTPEEQREQLQKTKAFAKALFYTIRGKASKRPFITLQDVELFYPDTNEGKRQAESAFFLFAQDPKAKVNMNSVVDAVMAIYKARGNIAASLSNTETMIDSLRGSLAAGLHFLFLALYMLIWNIDILAGFSAFSATVLALSFIFGNSIRNLFESMLFLFVEHPYDIGDWITFDNDHYEVVKITLLNTVFRDTGKQPTIMPNAALIPKQIKNLTRSDEHLELLFVEVDFGMAQVVKHEIKHRLVEFVKNNPNDYKMEPMWVTYVGVLPNMKANLLVIWCYACHPGDWDRKLPLRDRAIQLVTDIFARHGQNGAKYTFTHNLAGGVPPGLIDGGHLEGKVPPEMMSHLKP